MPLPVKNAAVFSVTVPAPTLMALTVAFPGR